MSLKKINDEGLKKVESFVREHGVERHLRKLSGENYVPDCEADVGDDILTEVFGEFYKSDPSKFCFRDGDKCLIYEIVDQLKRIVDKNGINTGLHKFKMKVRKPRNQRPNPIALKRHVKFDYKSNTETKCDDTSTELADLKSYLVRRVKSCFINHGADKITGTNINDLFDEETVAVESAGGRIYGNITCLICQHNKEKKTKKRVSYFQSEDKSYWVMSNFTKHLVDFHRLSTIRAPNQIIAKPITDFENKKTETNNLNEKSDDDDSVYIVNEVSVEIKPPEIDLDANLSNEVLSLYDQLSEQIGKTIGAVHINDDKLEQMLFHHSKNERAELTVAKIPTDGNCLFGAIVHQIWQHEIDSAEHETATSQLRNDVIDYILNPDNFKSFEFTLRDHVYERRSKQKQKGINMKEECKNFVRNVLSKEGVWGGHETIIAASRIYSTNIIVIYESGSYLISSGANRMYARTITLAYRLGANNIRNHYDSVCDIESEDIMKITDSITKQKK